LISDCFSTKLMILTHLECTISESNAIMLHLAH